MAKRTTLHQLSWKGLTWIAPLLGICAVVVVHAQDDPHVAQLCQDLQTQDGSATICSSQLEHYRPLSPVVFERRDHEDHVALYPGTLYARPRTSHDTIRSKPCRATHKDTAMTVAVAANGTKSAPIVVRTLQETVEQKISNEDDLDSNDSDDENEITGILWAQRFMNCMKEELPDISNDRQLIASHTRRCREIAIAAFHEFVDELDESYNNNNHNNNHKNRRDAVNAILRRVTHVWGEPDRLAQLLFAMNCTTDQDTHDDYLACHVQVDALSVQAKILQRNVHAQGDPWQCHTCHVHAHSQWFAARVVAGSVTYSVAAPTCPKANENVDQLPTQQELDADLSQSPSSTLGTKLDEPGTRFTMDRQDVVWETKERVTLTQGQSILMSPTWYHRRIPASKYDRHVAVLLQVQYQRDPVVLSKNNSTGATIKGTDMLRPHEVAHPQHDPQKMACYKFLDLYHALLARDLNVQQGIRAFPCHPDRLHHVEAGFNTNDYVRGSLHNEL